MQLELQHASKVPLLRTPPEGFCSSSYKHATPNGVKTVNTFLHGFGSGWNFRVLTQQLQLPVLYRAVDVERNQLKVSIVAFDGPGK